MYVIVYFESCSTVHMSQFLQQDQLTLVDVQLIYQCSLGFDRLCWHNFRIVGRYLSGISIKHYSRIIGSGDTFKGVV